MSVSLCPACECDLVPATVDPVSTKRLDARRNPVKFVELCRPRMYPLAMLIKQTLEAHDVAVIVQGGNSLSLMPQLAFGGELRILVDSSQLEAAKSLYEAYFEGQGEDFRLED